MSTETHDWTQLGWTWGEQGGPASSRPTRPSSPTPSSRRRAARAAAPADRPGWTQLPMPAAPHPPGGPGR